MGYMGILLYNNIPNAMFSLSGTIQGTWLPHSRKWEIIIEARYMRSMDVSLSEILISNATHSSCCF